MPARLRRSDCSGPGIRRRRRGRGFGLRRRGRRPRRRAGGARADRRAGDPARVGGRVDLPVSERAPPGDGHRRRRAQAVPLPRRLAYAARRGEVRRHGPVREGAAAAARGASTATSATAARPTAAACSPARCGCSSAASSGSARRSTPRTTRSYGLATMRKEHVTIEDGGLMVFDFPAKSGQRRRPGLIDERACEIVAALSRRRGGGAELLAYKDGRRWRDLRSDDINEYVKDATGGDHSAKDFRTWNATALAAVALAVSGESAAHEDGPQARDQARGRGGRGLPRQHAGRLPRVLHRPARVRRVRRPAHDPPGARARRREDRARASSRSTSRRSRQAVLDLIDERVESRRGRARRGLNSRRIDGPAVMPWTTIDSSTQAITVHVSRSRSSAASTPVSTADRDVEQRADAAHAEPGDERLIARAVELRAGERDDAGERADRDDARSAASSQPSQPGTPSPAKRQHRAEQQDHRELEQLLGQLGALVHARVDLVVVLVAAEREPAGERGEEAVGAGDLGEAVDHEHRRDRVVAVERRREQLAVAQPLDAPGRREPDRGADRRAAGDPVERRRRRATRRSSPCRPRPRCRAPAARTGTRARR